jgi:2-(1,2-epoxy-1,2-dihydrophenyl)acetyl-CoA isomerase
MRTDYKDLLIQQEGGVLTIVMNRPEVLNAISEAMIDGLGESLEEAAQDPSVRCIVLTGAGRSFGAGADVRDINRAGDMSVKIREKLRKSHRVVLAMRRIPKPVIAAVRGVAAGASCNLALACDMRIVADNARFIEIFTRIGLVPDASGGFFLPRLVGFGKALELAMLADEVSGPEAERLGLANKCVSLAEFEESVKAFAERLAKGPTRAYGLTKELMNAALTSDLEASLQLEGELQDQAVATADHREGVAAFLEKRLAEFTGN